VGGGEGGNSGLGGESDGRVVGRWFRGCRQSRTGGEPGGRGEMEKGDREGKEVLWVVGRGETADWGGSRMVG